MLCCAVCVARAWRLQAKDLMRDLERLLQLSCESARQLCGHMEVGRAAFAPSS